MVSLGVTPRSRRFPHVRNVGYEGVRGVRCTQGEICRKLGFTRDTLRFYERRGIIQPEVDPSNGYRYYDDWQVNLLWECKAYQSLGFSLAEVTQILQDDGLPRTERRMQERIDQVERDIRIRQLELVQLRRHASEMRRAPTELGSFELVDFEGRVFVPMREDHDLVDEADPSAVAFINAYMALALPLCLFPSLERDHYYWGFAMLPTVFDELDEDRPEAGREQGGFVRVKPARALATWIDAGERWNFGLGLFDGLVAESRSRGLSPRGDLCGDLVARTHEDDGYHRYVHAFLPLAQAQTPGEPA